MEWKLKHNGDKVLEAIAKVLKRDMGVNPMQVLRHFQLFPMAGLEKFLPEHAHDYENWYQIKDSMSHEVLFNYETEEYVLMYPDDFWTEAKIAILKQSEKKISKINENHYNEMVNLRESLTYKKLKPVIEWYFSRPHPFATLDIPKEYFNKLLSKHYKFYKIDSSENIKELTRELLRVYYYETQTDFFALNKNKSS